jgi:mRNA interferase RelE/StbE
VVGKIFDLLTNPRPSDSRELQGHPGLLRTDVGEFRIVYRYDDEKVYIDVVGKRNDGAVYKNI